MQGVQMANMHKIAENKILINYMQVEMNFGLNILFNIYCTALWLTSISTLHIWLSSAISPFNKDSNPRMWPVKREN